MQKREPTMPRLKWRSQVIEKRLLFKKPF